MSYDETVARLMAVPFRRKHQQQCASCRIPIPKQPDPMCSKCRNYINFYGAHKELYRPAGGLSCPSWRAILKAAVSYAYCWRLISFRAADWVFRHVDLRSA